MGVGGADDAGVYRIDSETALVQTVDFFTPVVDDPFDWGRITAANALSDVYAMGGRPLTALQLVGWPRDVIPFDVLGTVLEGGAAVMAEAGCTIVGGHSVDDPEPKYGFAVTGLVDPESVITNAAGRDGDALVLTKPLGTGIIATAIKAGRAPDAVASGAVDSMATLNRAAAEVMVRHPVSAATDVTGYGLLGHLREMLVRDDRSADIGFDMVPLLPGTVELVQAGVFPGGSGRNLESVRPALDVDAGVGESSVQILADAQTSGGLLIAVAAAAMEDLLVDLADAGVEAAAIGAIRGSGSRIRIHE